MADEVVETILVKLGLDARGYESSAKKATDASKKLDTSLESLVDVLDDIRHNTGESADQLTFLGDKLDKTSKTSKKTEASILSLGKKLKSALAGSAVVMGVKKLIDSVQQLNDELYFLEKNLGMSADTIKNWQGAAAMGGGSAQGMTSSIKSLNTAMNDFVIMGDTSLLPYMNSLGVAMVDANGKLRDTDQVMLDLADSFSKMDREQAFSLASKMGIDEGTFNTLAAGREELEKTLEIQSKIYKSSEEELKVSRDLARNRALLGTHWESMKMMLGNLLMPLFVKVSEVLLGMFDYLQNNQESIKNVFKGVAFVIGAVLTPILVKATAAAVAFMLPFAPFILTVGLLGAAFVALYEDYKGWADGANSQFDWGAFAKYIDNSTLSVDNLRNAFSNLVKHIRESVAPTLAEYGEIWDKLKSGDFKGAGKQAWGMYKNYASNVADVVDDIVGQEQGTLKGATKDFFKMGGANSDLGKVIAGNMVALTSGATASKRSGAPSGNQILDLIAKGEVGTTGKSGYDVAYRGARISSNKMFGKNLSDLTISEVKQLQKANINEQKERGLPENRRSSAMGRYQFIYTGFDEYIKAAGLKDTDIFSPENQDAMAMAMLNKGRYGLDAVRAGKATPEQFQNKVLSARWASIKNTGGGSQHNAAGFNKATIGGSTVTDAIRQSIRQNDHVNLSGVAANQAKANQVNQVTVDVGGINVNTTSSTIRGVATDATNAINDQIFQTQPSIK